MEAARPQHCPLQTGVPDGGLRVEPPAGDGVVRLPADDAPGGEQHDPLGTGRRGPLEQVGHRREAAEQEGRADAGERAGERLGRPEVAGRHLHRGGEGGPVRVAGEGPDRLAGRGERPDELCAYRGTPEEGPFAGRWTGPQFVLTHHRPETAVPGVTFVGDLDTGVAAAKAAAGEKYVNVLGANVAHQCLDAGMLDEILVLVAPVLLGDGVRLFDCPGGTNVRLDRVTVGHVPYATNLWFRVAR